MGTLTPPEPSPNKIDHKNRKDTENEKGLDDIEMEEEGEKINQEPSTNNQEVENIEETGTKKISEILPHPPSPLCDEEKQEELHHRPNPLQDEEDQEDYGDMKRVGDSSIQYR